MTITQFISSFQATEMVDALKAELVDLRDAHVNELTSLKAKSGEDRQMALNNLVLEHEVEMESLRNRLENSEKVAKLESKVKKLQETQILSLAQIFRIFKALFCP